MSNNTESSQIVRTRLKEYFGSVPDLVPCVLRAYDNAQSYGFETFGIEHLLLEIVPIPVFSCRLRRFDGNAAVLQRDLLQSFRTHRAVAGPGIHAPRLNDDMLQVINVLAADHELDPDRSMDEKINVVIDTLLLQIDGSAMAEQAIVNCGAERMLSRAALEDGWSDISDLIDEEFEHRPLYEGDPVEDEDEADPQEEMRQSEGGIIWREAVGKFSHINGDDANKGREKAHPVDVKQIAPVRQSQTDSKPVKSSGPKNPEARKALANSLRDLIAEANSGCLDRVVGRENEIDRIIATLKRRRKGSVLLYGEAGIGKTAIAEGVAMRIASGDDMMLKSRPVYELSLANLVAGTKYRGDFEEKVRLLLDMAREERAILFIDEIHLIMGAGSAQSQGMDAANLFKSAMARGELTVIGATTSMEISAIRKDAAMMRRFEPLMVSEPTAAETLEILEGAAAPYLKHHCLELSDGVLDAICRITGLYQPERRFPDKAFDLLDAACVVAGETAGFDPIFNIRTKLQVTHVETAADRAAIRRPRVPERDEIARLSLLEGAVATAAPGQTAAAEALSRRALEAMFDLNVGTVSYAALLVGPKRSGKDAAVAAMAEHLRMPLVVVDGISLSGPDAAIKLIGHPGSMDRDGILTDAVDHSPSFLLHIRDVDLLDESARGVIEVILRTGLVRNGSGRTISLRNAWIVGTLAIEEEQISGGFGFTQVRERDPDEAINKAIPAHFRALFGAAVRFKKVGIEDRSAMVRREIAEISKQLEPLGVKISVSDAVTEVIARETGSTMAEATRAAIMPRIAHALADDPSRELIDIRAL